MLITRMIVEHILWRCFVILALNLVLISLNFPFDNSVTKSIEIAPNFVGGSACIPTGTLPRPYPLRHFGGGVDSPTFVCFLVSGQSEVRICYQWCCSDSPPDMVSYINQK